MLDIKQLRQDPETVEKRLQSRDPSIVLKPITDLDTRLREIKGEVEHLKAHRNELSKEIGKGKREGLPTEDLMRQTEELAAPIHRLDKEEKELEEQFHDLIARLPNLPLESVPISQDPADNVLVRELGSPPSFSFEPKNHLELNEALHLFDFKRGAKLTGSGWPLYVGMGARLEWALLQYMVDLHVRAGYTMYLPPLLVRPETMYGSGQLPKFAHQLFHLEDEEYPFYLIPTAEVPLNGLHSEEILSEEELPKRLCSYAPSFRREAGAAGAQERGLIRLHQFNKVELFALAKPEESEEIFQEMVRRAEVVVEGLGLHYRSMELVTGDLGIAAAKTIDVEVWLPGQNRYYEVSSVSLCTDYQARRSHIRFRRDQGKPELVHTLNGSGVATSRLMVALLENNQEEDGSVTIPPALTPYLGGIESIYPTPELS